MVRERLSMRSGDAERRDPGGRGDSSGDCGLVGIRVGIFRGLGAFGIAFGRRRASRSGRAGGFFRWAENEAGGGGERGAESGRWVARTLFVAW